LIGPNWLKNVFLPETEPEGDEHRILVMDGHGSHVAIEFMWICKQNNACFVGVALSSDVSVFLTLVALLQLAASIVELAVVIAGIQYYFLSDCSVCVFLSDEFYNQRRRLLLRSASRQSLHIRDLRSGMDSGVFHLNFLDEL
jgi:hypothetical protein